MVAACPGGEFAVGKQAAAMMGAVPEVLQEFLDAAAAPTATAPIAGVFTLDRIVQAHTGFDAGRSSGEFVVTT